MSDHVHAPVTIEPLSEIRFFRDSPAKLRRRIARELECDEHEAPERLLSHIDYAVAVLTAVDCAAKASDRDFRATGAAISGMAPLVVEALERLLRASSAVSDVVGELGAGLACEEGGAR